MAIMKKVLIVEDEAIVAMSLSRALPRFGFEVSGVLASGREAIDSIDADQPNLILMDIHIIGPLDGIQTAEHIRARHDIPIIFMTGYDPCDIQERTRHLTNVTYVGKPVGIQTLTQTIEAMLASSTS